MNKLSEKSTIAASTVRDYLDALQPMTFAQVFRMCQASENNPGVSAEQSFTLSGGDETFDKLQMWSWDIIVAVIKHTT